MNESPPLYEHAWVGPALVVRHLLELLQRKDVISAAETVVLVDQALADLDKIPALQGEDYLRAQLTVRTINLVQ